MNEIHIKTIEPENRDWIDKLLEETWGSTKVVSRGRLLDAGKLPGLIAFRNDEPVGLLHYDIRGKECEVVTIKSVVEKLGIATALIKRVENVAAREGCKRLWLVTTNDNIDAIGFYLKTGLTLCAVHRNALIESRKLKPEIPNIGDYGIPINDEIEFEMILAEINSNEL